MQVNFKQEWAINVVNFMRLVRPNMEESNLLDKGIFHCIPLCNKHFPPQVNADNFGEINHIFPKIGNTCRDDPRLANDKSENRACQCHEKTGLFKCKPRLRWHSYLLPTSNFGGLLSQIKYKHYAVMIKLIWTMALNASNINITLKLTLRLNNYDKVDPDLEIKSNLIFLRLTLVRYPKLI